jgi:pimeloyl-ACP methyl ester carboxylesterase
MNHKSTGLFVPGGPWISGNYWDTYLESQNKLSSSTRFTLNNHEKSYSNLAKPNLKNAIDELNDTLMNNAYKYIVAHSYGAWITLMAMDESIFNNIESIIMVSMPFSIERTEKFKSEISLINPPSFSNNTEFKKYLKSISPLYFADKRFPANFFYEQVYMEGNEKLLFNQRTLEVAIRLIEKFNSKLHFIFGSNDLIVGEPWKTKDIREIHILGDSGHFPMIENPKAFTQILNNIIRFRI